MALSTRKDASLPAAKWIRRQRRNIFAMQETWVYPLRSEIGEEVIYRWHHAPKYLGVFIGKDVPPYYVRLDDTGEGYRQHPDGLLENDDTFHLLWYWLWH